MRRLAKCILIVSHVLAAAPAVAKGREPRSTSAGGESKDREARKACLAGDYATGVAILSDLFLETLDATYIFNQGRCLQQNERYEEAISRFREYLRTGTRDAELAQKHIAECETLIEARNRKLAQPAVEPSKVALPATAAPAAAAPTPVAQAQPIIVVQQNPQPQISSAGAGLRTAGVVLASVGGAALVAGVVLNLKANSVASTITPPNTYQRSTDSQRQTYETMSWVGYGLGAAGVAGGVLLYYLGWSSGPDRAVSLAPVVQPGAGGAALMGAF